MENLVFEDSFKKELNEIISETLDPKKTKKDILRIKKLLNSLLQNCKGEASEQELLQEFLDEYKKELRTTKNIEEAYLFILQHRAYKKLLDKYIKNKSGFDKIVAEAEKREKANNNDEMPITIDINECMIAAVRRVLRKINVSKEAMLIELISLTKGKIDEITKSKLIAEMNANNEKMLISQISLLKDKLEREIKSKLIAEMQEDLAFLNEYGFLDEYIESSNEKLHELGLEKLSYLKRNPIPDEKYDSHRNLVKDDEDIGVLDSFDTEYLEQFSVDELTRMAGFWKEKYMEARSSISEAMTTIDFLELWDEMLSEDDFSIENLDEDTVKNGLKNFEALAALFRFINNSEITEGIEKQYSMFLEKNGIKQKRTISEEFESRKPELENLRAAASDIVFSQCLIIYQLYSKEIKVKRWGVLKEDKQSKDLDDAITIVIEDSNFRGPLIIMVPKSILLNYLGIDDVSKLPTFKNPEKIDEKYRKIMEKLYLPTNTFYKKTVGEYYTENPQSPLIANLAGKKPKKIPDNKDDGSR